MDSPVSVDKSCIKSAAFEKVHPLQTRQTSYNTVFISCTALLVNVMARISVGIVFMSRENDF
jgi:hypothetical protein